MSVKSKDEKGYNDFSSGIDLKAIKAFTNSYTPKNTTLTAAIVVSVIVVVAILIVLFG